MDMGMASAMGMDGEVELRKLAAKGVLMFDSRSHAHGHLTANDGQSSSSENGRMYSSLSTTGMAPNASASMSR